MDNFILPILNDEQDLIIGTYPRLHFIEKRPSTRPPYSRQSRTRRISIHALNTKAIDCYLKFLNRKEFITHGISISKILFKNYLRISDISKLIPIDYIGFEISSESLKEWSTRA